MIMHFRNKLKFVTFLIAFAIGFFLKSSEAKMILLDRIYLIVNSQMITRSEAQDLSDSIKSQISSTEKAINDFHKKLLMNLVQELLLLDRAKALNISPTLEEINRKLEQLTKNKPKLLDAYTEEELKEQIAREFKKHGVISREVDSKIHLESKEIVLFCKKQMQNDRKISLAQILLHGSEEEIIEKVKSIRKSYNDGISFEKLAILHSADSKTRNTGGKLGIYKIEDLLPEIGIVANNLEPRNISSVVETTLGKHLFYIYEEIFPEGNLCDKINTEQKSKFTNLLYMQKRESLLNIYLNDLLACANIEIIDPGNSGLPNSNYLPVAKKGKINCLDRRTMILPQKEKKKKTNRGP